MAILVSGGAGYIGSHTCVELLAAGYDIVVADNYYNSCPEALARVKKIAGKDFRFVEADMTDKDAVEKIFAENEDIDCVIQFAAYKAVGESVSKPIEYYSNNLACTLNILDVMRRQNALVEDARAFFAENLAHELKIDDICTALGCTRPQLQQAFRARLHRTAMEEFSAMRIEYAAQLLARGASPGEVAAQMGYCSGAYFSQKFRAATGHTPSAYRRIQQGLPARRQNRQQKGKSESKTPIAEPPQKE